MHFFCLDLVGLRVDVIFLCLFCAARGDFCVCCVCFFYSQQLFSAAAAAAAAAVGGAALVQHII